LSNIACFVSYIILVIGDISLFDSIFLLLSNCWLIESLNIFRFVFKDSNYDFICSKKFLSSKDCILSFDWFLSEFWLLDLD
jgi:hypothetical protein